MITPRVVRNNFGKVVETEPGLIIPVETRNLKTGSIFLNDKLHHQTFVAQK